MSSIFALFQDYTFQTVALGSTLLGLISEVLRSFAVLRKQSLLRDSVSHSSLSGIVMVFALLGSKDTEALLPGAFVLGLPVTSLIISTVWHTRIKSDSVLALVMSVFLGLGPILLTYVQKIPNSNQAGLKRFIFGRTSTLLQRDTKLMVIYGLALFASVLLSQKEFKLVTFGSNSAQSIGFSPERLNLLLSFMIMLIITVGSQTVGVILMSAMLIVPAMAVRQQTNRLWMVVALSALFGAVSSVAGATASLLVPKLPTGPAIVVCVSIIIVVGAPFAPG